MSGRGSGSPRADAAFLMGGGEAGALMRAHDWASTPLGPPETWPQVLRVLVQVMLSSRQPMFILWGPERTTLYNDSYSEILANKHPAVGRRFDDIWPEIWEDVGPIVRRAYAGEPIHMDDIPLTVLRKGYPEETHFSFSYTPIRLENGAVAGFFAPCTETTERVLEQRRARLRDTLNTRIRELSDATEIMAEASRILGEHLRADQIVYAEIDEAADLGIIQRDWDSGVMPGGAGRHWLSTSGTFWDDLKRGMSVAIDDVTNDPRTRAENVQKLFARFSTAAAIKVPLTKGGRLVALLSARCTAPRFWASADIRLIEEVAERTWAAVARARAEAALRESERKYREKAEELDQLMEVVPVAIFLSRDPRCERTIGNRLANELYGVGEGDNLSSGPADSVRRGVRRWRVQDSQGRELLPSELPMQRAAATKKIVHNEEVVVILPDGKRFAMLGSAVPLCHADGRVRGCVGAFVDITERKRAEEKRRESEARLLAVTTHAPVGIGMYDRDGRWTFKNRTLERWQGELIPSKDPELIGRWHAVDEAGRTVPPDQWPGARALRGETVMPGISFRTEIDGEDRWLKVSAAPVPGEGQGVVIIEDVTEARRAEEQRNLLVREVNHRSKNILSIVQTIAQTTAGAGESDFLRKFQRRIQALSANQDLLVRSEWMGVDLDSLIRAQLAHFQDLLDDRIKLSGPPVVVAAGASQTLGMVLHELATNAGKYGALSTPEGRVDIEWRLRNDERDASLFSMRWCESGGPEVQPPECGGFGSTVIGDMAMMNLQAEVRLDYARSGLIWELDCPSEHCVETAGQARQESEYLRASCLSAGIAAPRGRILVVEDEALVALELAGALREAGHEVVGPVGSVRRALELLRLNGCDAAILDVNLGKETSEPVATELARRRTPFLAVSGYDRAQLPLAFQDAPLLVKPVRPELLLAEIDRCLSPVSASA